ncbi:hypothetical protein ScPMuIL_016429 [Solemya velum]
MEEKSPQGVAGAPNEQALLALMARTNYSMIQENGQRKYGGPPPKWEGPSPSRGCEIFVGKIPRDLYEDELVPVFEKIGRIYELRLMMDFSGSNRGYAFVMYTNKHHAIKAMRDLNNYEIRKGRFIGVCMSVDNCRLFVGGIPKTKSKDEIMEEMIKVTEGVVDIIVYPSAVDKTKNRGFAFVEYESHRAAAMARRKLIPGRIQLWGHQIAVDWAEPEQDVEEDIMSKVKILYVRNLMLTTSEETIKDVFTKAISGAESIERVKKIRDYAFVHFRERDDALQAMKALDNTLLEGSTIEVVLAKPVDKNEYIRYTRGKNSIPQVSFKLILHSVSYLSMGKNSKLTTYHTIITFSRGFQGRTAIGIRGAMRGRGRGAAGSRGAGVRAGFIQNFGRGNFSRYASPEEQLYDVLPGMELTPTNPVTLKPQSVKSSQQILEDMCQKNGWGSPVYQLHSTITRDGNGELQLFLFKVLLPALAPAPFQPNKLCKTVEEAKSFAADFVLAYLGVSYDGSDVPVVLNPYQGRSLGPALPVATGMPRSDITYASSVPVASSASYVVASGKMPAMPAQMAIPAEFAYELSHQAAAYATQQPQLQY